MEPAPTADDDKKARVAAAIAKAKAKKLAEKQETIKVRKNANDKKSVINKLF